MEIIKFAVERLAVGSVNGEPRQIDRCDVHRQGVARQFFVVCGIFRDGKRKQIGGKYRVRINSAAIV